MSGELRVLGPFVRRYRTLYALGAASVVVCVALQVAIPWFLGEAFDTLRALSAAEAEPGGVDAAALAPLVARAALAIAGTAVLVLAIRTASRLLILGASRRAVHDLRNRLFDRLLVLAPSFYGRNSTGNLMSRCVNDVTYVQSLLGPVGMYLLDTLVRYAFCLAVMLGISPSLTAVSFAPFPVFLWLARRQAVRIQRDSRAAQQELGEISAKVDESLSGHAVIQTLVLEDRVLAGFRERCDAYRRLNLEVTRARATLTPLMTGLASLSVFAVLALGGPRTVTGEVTLGDLVTMILYLQMMAGPTRSLGFVLSSVQRGTAALGRLRELLEAEVTLRDPAEPAGTIAGAEIRVRDLTVRLPSPAKDAEGRLAGPGEGGALRTVLDGVSFDVPAGSTLAIVGHTGSGKSTLVSVLARQLEVEPGHVFVDGVDVTRMTLDEVRRNVGFVPQETFLFSTTLAENVALGEPDAEWTRIEHAAEVAQLSKDLSQLPHGLETLLGERGVNLSGGQRQRTALARAALLEPKILILDDTLSAVDAHTAEEILERLRPLMAGRTTILVAHRLATVEHADRILVLADGRVAESGTHAELLARGGPYAALWRQQRSRERLAAELGAGRESVDRALDSPIREEAAR